MGPNSCLYHKPFPASRGLSRRGLSFLPLRERPLLAGNINQATKYILYLLASSLNSVSYVCEGPQQYFFNEKPTFGFKFILVLEVLLVKRTPSRWLNRCLALNEETKFYATD